MNSCETTAKGQSLVNAVGVKWSLANELVGQLLIRGISARPYRSLFLLTLLWLVPGTAELPFLDRDEPRFAHAAKEMIERGSFAVPYFNGEYRFDKPPLVYWWQSLHFAVFGYGEFTARLHSLEATVLLVFLVFGFSRRLLRDSPSRTTAAEEHEQKVTLLAWWSTFAFLLSQQMFWTARLCVADMVMMVFVVLSQWALWELWRRSSWYWTVVLWTALALGFSTKWFVPWMVTGTTAILFMLLKKQILPWRNFRPLIGTLLMLAIIGVWAVPAWIETDGAYFRVGIGKHVFWRAIHEFHGRGSSPLFYLGTAFLSLAPWIAFSGGLPAYLKAEWNEANKFLVAWIVGPLLVFSLMRTQLPHYMLPAFPAFFILLTAATNLQIPSERIPRVFFHFLVWIWVAVLSGVVLVVVSWWEELQASCSAQALATVILGLVLLFLLSFLLVLFRAKSRLLGVVLVLSVGAFVFQLSAETLRLVIPALQVQQYLSRQGSQQLLIVTGIEEPSFVAYSQQKIVFDGDFERAKNRFEDSPQAVWIALEREYPLMSVLKKIGRQQIVPRHDHSEILRSALLLNSRKRSFSGLNVGRLSWVSYQVFSKD